MNIKVILIILFLVPLKSQDRSLVFSTGSPDDSSGFAIQNNGSTGLSISDRFYINSNMVLEAMKIYASSTSNQSNATVILQSDNNNLPGEQIYSWDVDVSELNHGNNYFLIVTTDLCIYLDEGNYYWISIHASNSESEITWHYSNNSTFTYSTSNNMGANWSEAYSGRCGAISIWSEYIYETEVDQISGDVNADGALNILDVVMLANAVLNGDFLIGGDLNDDGSTNVLDVVSLVNTILNGSNQQLSNWLYEDINVNSSFFGQMIGPGVFNGNVSLYYFGKSS